MATRLTIDTSVYLNALRVEEVGHAASRALIGRLNDEDILVILPTLLLVEVAAALGRAGSSERTSMAAIGEIRAIPGTTLLPLSHRLANAAAEVGARHRLRGSDAVFAAVALQHDATLVTLDRQQLERMASVITTTTPAQLL